MPDKQHHVTRPLDAAAIAITVMLCLSWGFNQVSVKLAIHDIPPLLQGTLRSIGAAVLVSLWCKLRGLPLFARDGSLGAGIAAGVFFGIEFILIYQGLATPQRRARSCSSISRRSSSCLARASSCPPKIQPAQWLGLALSFAGMLVAFGVPTPALDPRQMIGDLMMSPPRSPGPRRRSSSRRADSIASRPKK